MAKSLPQVTGLRHWSTPEYTRIVVDVEEKVSLRQRLLKKDPTIEKPERLFLDLYPARLNKELKEPLAIRDGLLRSARAGQYDHSTVRIVLDIESIKGYKVFFLENPFRLIIDVTGKEKRVAAPLPDTPMKDQKLSLAQQLGLGVKRVVIDAGHGGKDKGAIGDGTLYEKDLTLQLAKKLAHKIRQELKIQAIMTREGDRFIPLEERTAIANTRQADLFLSIHINASPNPLAQGVETYFLNLASDEEAVRVAALENATSTKRIGDLQKILKDLMLNTKIDESSRLAHHVQLHLHDTLNGKFGPIKNLGVKQAPFYVLIGAQMPSILVEASFISNSQDRERLMQEDYQDQIVEGIFKGVERYIKETKLGWNQPEIPRPVQPAGNLSVPNPCRGVIPKFETRNPKSETNSNYQNPNDPNILETWYHLKYSKIQINLRLYSNRLRLSLALPLKERMFRILNFRSFEFVSDFVLRISNLNISFAYPGSLKSPAGPAPSRI